MLIPKVERPEEVRAVQALVDELRRDGQVTEEFFLVPIVYHRRMVSDRVRALTSVDPMRWIIEQFRDVLYHGRFDALPSFLTLAGSAAVFLVTLVLFTRLSFDLAKEV